ncbi:MAG: DNA polymerase Y family protein [Pseudomonadota bacterium]
MQPNGRASSTGRNEQRTQKLTGTPGTPQKTHQPQGKTACDIPAADISPLLNAPFVLTEAGATGLRVACANAPAQAKGVTPGLKFTDATARAPEICAEPIDRTKDACALVKLAEWLVRFAPLVALDDIDGLMLDVTGCAHLHGGENTRAQETAMARRLSAALDAADIPHRLALASAPLAAAAAARYWPKAAPTIIPSGEEKAALKNLPMAALGLSEETRLVLRRFGLTRIGQLYDAPRKALARRFTAKAEADAVLLRLDEALGVRIKPLRPLRPMPDFIERLSCPEPLLSSEGVTAGLAKLAARLGDALTNRSEGGRHFTLFAFRSDGDAARVTVTTAAPVNNAKHLAHLFREKIDGINPSFGIDALALEAHRIAPMTMAPRPLSTSITGPLTGSVFAKNTIDMTALSALADRLTAKLGDGSVLVATPKDTHRPQDAEVLTPFAGAFPAPPPNYGDNSGAGNKPPTEVASPPAHASPTRPLRTLATPEPITALAALPDGPPARFIWRRVARRVKRADGPERIAPEWRNPDGQSSDRHNKRTRDYYRVEDETGRRYWLYREGLYGQGPENSCADITPDIGEGDKNSEQAGEQTTSDIKDDDQFFESLSHQPPDPKWFLCGFFP